MTDTKHTISVGYHVVYNVELSGSYSKDEAMDAVGKIYDEQGLQALKDLGHECIPCGEEDVLIQYEGTHNDTT